MPDKYDDVANEWAKGNGDIDDLIQMLGNSDGMSQEQIDSLKDMGKDN